MNPNLDGSEPSFDRDTQFGVLGADRQNWRFKRDFGGGDLKSDFRSSNAKGLLNRSPTVGKLSACNGETLGVTLHVTL